MQTLAEKTILAAEALLRHYRNPIILASFGKDSLVLVHLLRHLGLPVICHRLPGSAHKWDFANRIISEWGLTVYDYPPEAIALAEKDGNVELFAGYNAGGETQRFIISHFDKSKICDKNGRVRCGLREYVNIPIGGIVHQWDLAFAAQKDGDPDRFYGRMNIRSDVRHIRGGCSTAFPMREWKDADVWAYIREFQIPINAARYEKGGGGWEFRERQDKTHNPDWIQACDLCINRKNDSRVACPLLGGALVDNVANQIRHIETEL